MAIKQINLPNGKIVYEVYVQELNVHGKRIQKRKKGLQSLKAAKDCEALMRSELLMAKGRPQQVTWGMWLDRVLNEMKVTHRPTTVDTYTLVMNRWTGERWRDRFLHDIAP